MSITKKEAQFNARLGQWLKQLRMNKKLTQRELGETIGAHRNTIGRYEEGGALPLYAFMRICEKLDVAPAEVVKW
jgi:transcriptional regulator with XRE-family HTH domain